MKNQLNSQTRFIPVDHLDKVGEIAVYYGFTPVKSPVIVKADIDAARNIADE